MNFPKRLIAVFGVVLLGVIATGETLGAKTAAISVSGAWARPAAKGMPGAVYLTLTNPGSAPDRLVSITTPVAKSAMIHVSRMEGGVMTMRAVAGVDVSAKGKISFAPGGMHVMLEGLNRALKPGDTVPLDVTFARAGHIHVIAPVRQSPPAAPMAGMKM